MLKAGAIDRLVVATNFFQEELKARIYTKVSRGRCAGRCAKHATKQTRRHVWKRSASVAGWPLLPALCCVEASALHQRPARVAVLDAI